MPGHVKFFSAARFKMFLQSKFPSNLYSLNSVGERALIGLTFQETIEFEELDAIPPVDEQGNLFPWPTEGRCLPPSEDRWLELYEKHMAACRLLDGASGR